MCQSPISEKHIFPAENTGNMPEKPVFWHFLEISSLVFSNFLHKEAYQECSTHARVRLLRNFFSGRKYRKYAGNRRFCRFSLDFFLIFRVFFSHKNIYDIAFFFVRSFVRLFVLSLLSGRSNQHVACFSSFISFIEAFLVVGENFHLFLIIFISFMQAYIVEHGLCYKVIL